MLHIYNTYTRQKELFKPLEPLQVRMYVCGMTVYDYCHLGHARVMVVFDMVQRWLRNSGYEVTYVRNITDIDDKIIQRALVNGESIRALTDRFIKAMHEDADALGIQRPDHEPRATEYVDEMLAMIEQLEAKGLAYQADNGDVNYAVRQFKHYGRLSGKSLDELRAGERVAIASDKRDPLDFVLWKSAKTQEPEDTKWASKWGVGRPGWHIECSAMSKSLLGDYFDIHGGGADLQFPHHENEIAQSEGALCGGEGCGCDERGMAQGFVKHWMHNGFIRVDNEKMSKSLGNFFTIRDVLKEFDAEVVRFFILRAQYRSPLNYSNQHLNDARSALNRLYTSLKPFTNEDLGLTHATLDTTNEYVSQFKAAMDDDFNTAVAVSVLFDLANAINKCTDLEQATQLARQLKLLGGVLGLLERESQQYLQAINPEHTVDVSNIEALIEQRSQAKRNKDFKLADDIRGQLLEMGIVIEDKPGGAVDWRQA